MATLKNLTTLALAGVVGLGIATQVPAASAAEFYQGKRIKIIVGSGPGGGYDTYARLIGRHMGRHIPGKPSFLVQNKQGAGSIVAMNFVQNVLPKDGSVIAGIQRNIALVQIMGEKLAKFDVGKINWLGSLADEAGLCALATRTGVKIGDFGAAFKREFMMAGLGPNDTEMQPALFNNALGTKFKLIKGYPGTPEAHLAIQRGEVDGICQSWSSFKRVSGKYYTDGNIRPIVQLSLKPHPELAKLGVPMVFDYITKDRVRGGLSPEDVKNYLLLVFAAKAMGRPFAMAEGVPAQRVKIVRTAFNAMAKDKIFLADAKKQKREVTLATGEEIQKIVAKMASTPKSKLARLDDLLKFKGQVKKITFKMAKHTGKVTATKRGGRRIFISYKGKKVKAKVSGSRTKVTINGKKAKRKAIKVGMTCTFTYPSPGSEAKKVDCKG